MVAEILGELIAALIIRLVAAISDRVLDHHRNRRRVQDRRRAPVA